MVATGRYILKIRVCNCTLSYRKRIPQGSFQIVHKYNKTKGTLVHERERLTLLWYILNIDSKGGQNFSHMGTTGQGIPGLGTPGLVTPGLVTPGLGTPGLVTPGLVTPGLGTPGLGTPGLGTPGTKYQYLVWLCCMQSLQRSWY